MVEEMEDGLVEGWWRAEGRLEGCFFEKVGEWMEVGLQRMSKYGSRVGKDLGRLGWARMVEQSENG